MLRVTRGQQLTTAITGSYPRPLWYEVNLRGQSFKSALGDSMFREQYIGEIEPAVAVGHHEYYKDDHALINDLSDIMNAELRELSAAGLYFAS
jgi:methionine synthase II (cobalamin-independent)